VEDYQFFLSPVSVHVLMINCVLLGYTKYYGAFVVNAR